MAINKLDDILTISRKMFVAFVFFLGVFQGHSSYKLEKLSNDQCLTLNYEGSVKVLATGSSGPYIVIGPNRVTKNILLGQNHVVFNNLPQGHHEFKIFNAKGCETILSINIFKVRCGACLTSKMKSLTDYLVTNEKEVSKLSSTDLANLTKYFTGDFTIDSDLPTAKICYKDMCINSRGNSSTAQINYSDISEIKGRLKNTDHDIKIFLYKYSTQVNPAIVGNVIEYKNLSAGNYKLLTYIDTMGGMVKISSQKVQIRTVFCKKSKINVDPIVPESESENEEGNEDGEITSLSEVQLGGTHELEISTFPNPLRGQVITLNVKTTLSGPAKVVVFNSLGEQIHSRTINPGSGENSYNLTLPQIRAGVYKVLVQQEGAGMSSARIIKVN